VFKHLSLKTFSLCGCKVEWVLKHGTRWKFIISLALGKSPFLFDTIVDGPQTQW
jgi:hypothetical protein